MKKKILLLLMGTLMCLTLAGCGKDKKLGDSAQRERKESAKKVEADIKETDESIEEEQLNIDDAVVEKYEGTIVDGGTTTEYTVELLDDGSAKVFEMYHSNKNCYSTYTYFSDSYEKEDDCLKIPFRYDDGSFINFKVYLDDNGAITKVTENYDDYDSDTSKIAGTYTRKNDDNYGDMTLTVDTEGGAILETDEMTYYGVIYIFDGDWDFVGDNDKDDVLDYDLVESVDLFIYFSNDSFTYKSYAETRYENYAGTYKMVGDLGTINLYVDGAGNADCTATVDGITMNFNGSFDYYEDMNGETTYDAYLTSEDGMYSLSISFLDLGDGTYNYQGSVSKTLGAG